MIKKYSKHREKQIIDLLKSKNLYEPSDIVMVKELVYWIKLSDEAKTHIDSEGIVVNVVRDPDKTPLYQTNQAVSVLKEASAKIAMLYTKLSISPQERSKLKVEDIEDNIDFEDDFING